ncbi:hypothetical protein BVC93_00640 [Mycobacterium sp. MS1601]|uniref:hypothetical protein n=1 Tax=Mycobacterium sp. MS1601 TaxID=1936029 RepID=UPI000979293F|nr:hypothetical protein [Mycobacterium sp. MS1601]AQA01171.1 hypothetical protein BVC93_00640 [Mycobacterium sp. MS1601]
MNSDLEATRAVADALLYEGYLLYPYRASSGKNQCRWQFGVLGPPGAATAGVGEPNSLSAQFPVCGAADMDVTVRFLQLQHRRVEQRTQSGYTVVDRLETPAGPLLTWDEAVEVECRLDGVSLAQPVRLPVTARAHTEVEDVEGGRIIRQRRAVAGRVEVSACNQGPAQLVTVTVRNTGAAATSKSDALSRSMISAHVIVRLHAGRFISLLEPPAGLQPLVDLCRQDRCFPVLAGSPACDDVLLISPIILYDHPEIAPESRGALYDATEIDEILTLRVMALTDGEKAEARATDPRAARVVEQCDGMTAEAMLGLHGARRDIDPAQNCVIVDGVPVQAGCRVRLRPTRRADAQDMFISGRTARVTAVHEDLDGAVHIAVVVEDDPAADLHDWYGRYLYFSPEEIDPFPERSPTWR